MNGRIRAHGRIRGRHAVLGGCVTDCDETAAAVLRLGGRVTAPPFDIAYGRMAVLADDQGAAFAVLAEAKPEPGAVPGREAGAERAPDPGDPGDATAREASRIGAAAEK